MKKSMKIVSLGIVLVASLLLLSSNKTNAIGGQVSFSITGTTNTQCTYGTSWVMGQYPATLSAFTATWNLQTFICTDTQWLSTWNMNLLESSTVTNGTTIIPATGVSMQATTNVLSNGACTPGTNTTTMTSIGATPWTIMIKASAVNQVCTITTSWVVLNVAVPAAATLGSYTWTLSLTLPW